MNVQDEVDMLIEAIDDDRDNERLGIQIRNHRGYSLKQRMNGKSCMDRTTEAILLNETEDLINLLSLLELFDINDINFWDKFKYLITKILK
jgi:hypothetical protein